MPTDARPRFRALDATEMRSILTRNHVGRMAYSFHDRVNIVPVHYLYSDGWIYGRTSPGEKVEILAHHKWVAFEVDEVEGPYDWRSVVVYGGLYVLEPDDDAWRPALDLIRTAVPDALSGDDPTPFRTALFRIAIQESSGREAASAPPG
jgi:nitroimidazol reductase NimA-like FMN-containing flavoprotein (pyridoxamine 5'-phosphate oxidase superfamily)